MLKFFEKTVKLLEEIYGDRNLENTVNIFFSLYDKYEGQRVTTEEVLSEKDVMLITYGDSITCEGKKPLKTLKKFLDNYCKDEVTNVHLLPICPSTSDDGFSVSDYRKVDENLGDWEDIRRLSEGYGLMLDAVVNHTSKSHMWFKACLDGDNGYNNFYIVSDPDADYSLVTRPRTLPLLTKFSTAEGDKFFWTTFSDDQVDLNYSNPKVLAEVIDVLLFYASCGARFIRLDAIGFIYKRLGTNCMHLHETHAIVKLMRLFLENFFPGTYIITETNVPHEDNISYFGNGDEAHLVYQFPLPPLVMFSLQMGDATKLTGWAKSLESFPLIKGSTYFNFLASHDGIGLRPIEGILDECEKELLIRTVEENGGRISYKLNQDGSKSPYELNISYMDGITNPSKGTEERFKRFMASQAIMLSLQGVPGIYYHSLLGSGNWHDGVESSGINRRINREKLDYQKLAYKLEDGHSLRHMVLSSYKKLLSVRGNQSAFSPYAGQNILDLSSSLFAVERTNETTGEKIVCIINVTDNTVKLNNPIKGRDLLTPGQSGLVSEIFPYQVAWILV